MPDESAADKILRLTWGPAQWEASAETRAASKRDIAVRAGADANIKAQQPGATNDEKIAAYQTAAGAHADAAREALGNKDLAGAQAHTSMAQGFQDKAAVLEDSKADRLNGRVPTSAPSGFELKYLPSRAPATTPTMYRPSAFLTSSDKDDMGESAVGKVLRLSGRDFEYIALTWSDEAHKKVAAAVDDTPEAHVADARAKIADMHDKLPPGSNMHDHLNTASGHLDAVEAAMKNRDDVSAKSHASAAAGKMADVADHAGRVDPQSMQNAMANGTAPEWSAQLGAAKNLQQSSSNMFSDASHFGAGTDLGSGSADSPMPAVGPSVTGG